MDPSTSFGVIRQKAPGAWRGVGDTDDCAICSDLMCVHGTAQWLVLRTTPVYREAAGNPDDPTHGDGLTIQQSEKAIRTLYPSLAITVQVYTTAGMGAAVAARIASRRAMASVSVMAGMLPDHGTFLDEHRVAIASRADGLFIGNPLKDAYSTFQPITQAQLAKAIDAYPRTGLGGVIYFPTVDEAFLTHPLLAGVIQQSTAALQARIDAAAKILEG